MKQSEWSSPWAKPSSQSSPLIYIYIYISEALLPVLALPRPAGAPARARQRGQMLAMPDTRAKPAKTGLHTPRRGRKPRTITGRAHFLRADRGTIASSGNRPGEAQRAGPSEMGLACLAWLSLPAVRLQTAAAARPPAAVPRARAAVVGNRRAEATAQDRLIRGQTLVKHWSNTDQMVK